MGNTISVRFCSDLYNKVIQHDLSNSVLIRKAVLQYFRSLEPNHKIDGGLNPDSNTTSYNVDLVSLLQDQIQDLKNDKVFLQDRMDQLLKINGTLTVATNNSLGSRIKFLISGKNGR